MRAHGSQGFVQGTTNHDCAQGVSSRPNSVACRPRNQRKKLTMGRNSTQIDPLPQYGAEYSEPHCTERATSQATRELKHRLECCDSPQESFERESGGFCAK